MSTPMLKTYNYSITDNNNWLNNNTLYRYVAYVSDLNDLKKKKTKMSKIGLIIIIENKLISKSTDN